MWEIYTEYLAVEGKKKEKLHTPTGVHGAASLNSDHSSVVSFSYRRRNDTMARSDKSRSRSSSGGSHKAAGTGARTAKSAASGVPLPIPEGDNVHTQEALDVAAENDADEGEFDAEEYDGASSASTSIRSSILDHEYERGRRVSI